MILNQWEFLAMNNPVRAAIQRRYEAPRLRAMGGNQPAGRALEIGCGRGVGVQIILGTFGAESVEAFDLDPRMVDRATRRLRHHGGDVRIWAGDASHIDAADGSYDTVFDFGIIHHIPRWRQAVGEVFRVLKPGGVFYCEEVLRDFIGHPLWRALLHHPQEDRFDHNEFKTCLADTGFMLRGDRHLWNWFGWYVADKPNER